MPTRDHLGPLDHTLLALADPTRRAILTKLAGGEARVTDVAADFAISLNSISKHLRILERAKLVYRRREGRNHYLRYNPATLEMATRWMVRQEQLWSTQLAALDAFLRDEDVIVQKERNETMRSEEGNKR